MRVGSQLDSSTAVGLTYAEVVPSDVCGGAAREADEIAAAEPDRVSVQEAAVWTGPVAANCPGAATPATIDALAALLTQLAANGAHYTVVKELGEFSSAPLGLVAPGLSFLDHDVMLGRVEPADQLSVRNVRAQHYSTLVSILRLLILRGWISADATLGGRTGLTERIDLVLVRGNLVPSAVTLTGTTPPYRSDHAGDGAVVRIPS